MGIGHCKSCGKKFEYGEVFRSYWKLREDYRSLKCCFCGQQHIFTPGSDMLAYFILVGIPMLVTIQLGIGAREPLRIFLLIGLPVVLFVLSFLRPYIVRYQPGTDLLEGKRKHTNLILIIVLFLLGIILAMTFFWPMQIR